VKFTATELVTQWTCPFLRYVSYEVREPLPVWGARRRFGNVIHAAIAAYERSGGRPEKAAEVLDERSAGLSLADLEEARAILAWRHGRAAGREGRPLLIEGSLRSYLGAHRIDVRMDRLDACGRGYLLAEYKGGRHVDPELVRVQLRILSFAILDVFRRAPALWEVELLRARRVLELPAEQDPEALRGFVAGLAQAILGGDREARPYSTSFCARCPAKAYCPKWSSCPKPLSRALCATNDRQRLLF
jgi:hypothetical protein